MFLCSFDVSFLKINETSISRFDEFIRHLNYLHDTTYVQSTCLLEIEVSVLCWYQMLVYFRRRSCSMPGDLEYEFQLFTQSI